MLKGKTVLVTGATGAIGCRVMELLALEHGASVRCLVRNYSRAARIARFPVDIIKGEITDRETLDEAVKGCEAVIHCAYDWLVPQHNIDAARMIGEACIRHDVRMVQVSTMAVYEPLPTDGSLDESTSTKPNGDAYHDTKLSIEADILAMTADRGLRATILQPTVVYGPYGGVWTDEPVKRLLQGIVVLPDGGDGLCSAVYIDDVADAMILAASSDAGVGERLIISGPDAVTWHAFYSRLRDALGVNSLSTKPVEEIRRENKNLLRNLKLAINEPKRFIRAKPIRNVLVAIYSKMSPALRQKALKVYRYRRPGAPKEVFIPNEQQIALYSTKAVLTNDKAREVLGYDPAFTFDKGMALTEDYVRWAYSSQLAAAA